uniref:Uncharacterized protein n=1 Tax=Aliivibrio fischeri TaxID=668 RepID=H2ES92_ALIFS|nr:hypothetical protein [Aliivibrio fischeri]AEY78259.1 hypothetical protein [Aliivibrio fischeri]
MRENSEERLRQYVAAKDALESSLVLYRLAIVNNMDSEMLLALKKVNRDQMIYESLYRQLYTYDKSV